jgi:dihydrofolate synthase/folylpolyglutamate synthase
MNRNHIQTYDEALSWIHGIMRFGIKPGLKRMEWMLERLGHPERRLKFIHVAGTNGKGSTSSFLATILQKAGYDVGLYTSPYLEKFTNRIKLNGVDIPEADVVEFVQMIFPLYEELSASELGSPTEFEVVTTLAILYYAKKTFPDYVVWETGLGGRYDSTNVVYPVISVITNIGMDHVQFLGDTLEQIAFEKAGIIKPGVPVVTGVDDPTAHAVIATRAREAKSTLYTVGEAFSVDHIRLEHNQSLFDFKGPFGESKDLAITLKGEHQVKNAAVALSALAVLGQYMALIIEEDDLREALLSTSWPGRFEKLSDEPEIIIDGAHNSHGTSALAKTIQQYYPNRTIHLMMGVLADKPLDGMLEPLLPLIRTMTVTQPDFRRAAQAEDLAAHVQSLAPELPIHIIPDWKMALQDIVSRCQNDDLLLITGSLYLISDVRTEWLLSMKRKVGETL